MRESYRQTRRKRKCLRCNSPHKSPNADSSLCAGAYSATPIRNISPPLFTMGESSAFARMPVWALISPTRIHFTKYTETLRAMWKYGDVIAWREIFRGRIWHALAAIVVKDSPQEIVLAVLPGAERLTEEHYPQGKNNGRRRWDFRSEDWCLENFPWHTTRALQILEPAKFFSTIYFWDNASGEFLCYYINFQTPFKKKGQILDTLDLDLDLIIRPDYSFEWKDLDDYQKAIEAGMILPEWVHKVETTKEEIFGRLERREYPLDGSWINWKPDLKWLASKLPEDWNKI